MIDRAVIAEKIRLLRPHRRNGVGLLPGTVIEVPINEAETFIARGWGVSEGLVYDDPPKPRRTHKTPAASADPNPTHEEAL